MSQGGFFSNSYRYIYARRKFFLFLTIILLVLAYALFGRKGLIQRVELELENKDLKQKLVEEQKKTELLKKEIDELKTSEKKIDKVAREKYNMTKEGEEVYKIQVDSSK